MAISPVLACMTLSRRASPHGFNLLFPRPVVLWAGWPFFERAWASVVHRSLNMFTLIALGTGAAYLYSLFAIFAPGMFPAGFRGMGGEVSVFLKPLL